MLNMKQRKTRALAAAATAGAVAAAAWAMTGQAQGPRVFFVSPADGATVSSPVAFEFGSEGFSLLPVPEEVEQPRFAAGHYHIGIDTECLPAGEIIPQSAPWVHFGDGSSVFETLMPPGEHTFAVQIGDDEHRTLEGLCSTVTVTVE